MRLMDDGTDFEDEEVSCFVITLWLAIVIYLGLDMMTFLFGAIFSVLDSIEWVDRKIKQLCHR